MSRPPLRLVLAIVFTAATIALLAWSLWQFGRSLRRQSIGPAEMQLPVVTGTTSAPAIAEMRLLTVDFPPVIRAGDVDVVRLTLAVDARGNLTPTVSAAGDVIQGQPLTIPNLYDTHNVLAEARLDLAGVDVRPADTASETLRPGQPVLFFWSARPARPGSYRGTVWLFLRFIPKDGGPESRQPLSAQAIEIEATAPFGIAAGPARWLGVAGAFVSALLGLPFLAEALKWVWRRAQRKTE